MGRGGGGGGGGGGGVGRGGEAINRKFKRHRSKQVSDVTSSRLSSVTLNHRHSIIL